MHQKSPTLVMTICIEGHLLFIFIRSEVKARCCTLWTPCIVYTVHRSLQLSCLELIVNKLLDMEK